MARHRGTYKPENPVPYELGRSRIQNFMDCPACFYLDRVKGIPVPSMYGWPLNSATDVLLKKDFDANIILNQLYKNTLSSGQCR